MPIERKKDRYEFDDEVSVESTDDVTELPESGENEVVEEREVETDGDAGNTATLSATILGGKKVNPGDTVRLEVVSVSDDDGTVTVRYSQPNMSDAAMEFDKPMKGM